MNIEFLEPAEVEFNDAIAFYNLQREGLGFEFEGEVKNTIEKIVRSPEAWTSLSKRTRRCQTKRFPYGVIYQIRGETLLIVAVMHLKRNPHTWRTRIPKNRL